MSFTSVDDTYIEFGKKLETFSNCEGDNVILELELYTNSRKKIEVHSFNFNDNDFTLEVNGKESNASETFKFNKRRPLKLKVTFKRDYNKKQELFKFKTNHREYLENSIKVEYGTYKISSKSIRKGTEQIVNISESCTDSIAISFPYGGTITSVIFYKDSLQLAAEPFKRTTYGIGDKNNYLKFSKADIGIYHVGFSSCHWGNDFVLHIK